MEEIPEIISPHSDNSSELSLTPKYEKSMYIKELNIFKRKKSIDISFTENLILLFEIILLETLILLPIIL